MSNNDAYEPVSSQIIAYEMDELSDEETVALFQRLVNTGLAWQLQGHYGRTAQAMLNAGLISSPFQVVAEYDDTTYPECEHTPPCTGDREDAPCLRGADSGE